MNDAIIPFRLPDPIAKDLCRVLEDEIVFGQLAPETRLVEEEVAKRYGVSRSPVREALRLLEQGGLVVREARRGIWVAPIGRADLDEVYSCRVTLEGLAAEQAARARTPAHVQALRMTFADMEKAHDSGDTRAYFRSNVRLSEAIHAAANNATLRRLLNSIGQQAQRYRYLAYSKAPHLVELSLAGNRDVIDAIAQADPVRAREITERLIRRSWETVGIAIDQEIAQTIAKTEARTPR
jgi:DNA-binding GntR family transcriptional regulator